MRGDMQIWPKKTMRSHGSTSDLKHLDGVSRTTLWSVSIDIDRCSVLSAWHLLEVIFLREVLCPFTPAGGEKYLA